MLPNLVIIGASRCGTTSLHSYLGLHPQISMSRTKELNFFVAERNWGKGVAWYSEQFGDAVVRGESSPHYTARSRYPGVPGRMSSLVPDAKLLYVVRDPIARALSAFSLARAMGLDDRPLERAMVEDFREGFYLEEGRYWLQLEPFLARFPAAQVLVLDQHELRNNRRDTLRMVFRYLGVDDGFDSEALDREHNRTPRGRRNRLGAALVPLLDRAVGPDRSRRLRAAAPTLARLPFVGEPSLRPSGPPEDGLLDEMRAYFADDTDQLRRFSGLALDTWSV